MKVMLIAGWVMIVPIASVILTNNTIADGDNLLKAFAYGAIGFAVGIMVASSVTVYYLNKLR